MIVFLFLGVLLQEEADWKYFYEKSWALEIMV